jgi:hypothetical protein
MADGDPNGAGDKAAEKTVDAAQLRREAFEERQTAHNDRWWLDEPIKSAFDEILAILKNDKTLWSYRRRVETAETARKEQRRQLEAERERMAAEYKSPIPRPFRRNELRQPEFDEVAAWVAAKALELAFNWREPLCRDDLEYIYPNGLKGELAVRLADEAARQAASQDTKEDKDEETPAVKIMRAEETRRDIKAELKEVERHLKGQKHPFKGKGRPPSQREFIDDMRVVWELAFGRIPGAKEDGDTPFMKVCNVAFRAAHPRSAKFGRDAFRKNKRTEKHPKHKADKAGEPNRAATTAASTDEKPL